MTSTGTGEDLSSVASVDELDEPEQQLQTALGEVRARKINGSGRHHDAAATSEGTEEETAEPPSLAYLLNVKEKSAAANAMLQLCPQMAARGRTSRAILAVLVVAALALPLAAAMDGRPFEVTAAAAAAPARSNEPTPAAAPAQSLAGFTLLDDGSSNRNARRAAIVLGTIAGSSSFVVLAVYLLASWRERRQRRATQDVRGRSVSKVTVAPYEPPGAPEAAGEEDCDICLEAYVRGDEIGVLPCTHRYHAACIRRWIAIGTSATATCPRCREVV